MAKGKATKDTRKKKPQPNLEAAPYKHPEAKSLMRPEVGTQAQFKKKKPAKTYRYDSSLSPTLDWDAKDPAREQGEQLIKQVLDAKSLEEAKAAASKLKSLSKPFLNWAGKAERLSFDVPTSMICAYGLKNSELRGRKSMIRSLGVPFWQIRFSWRERIGFLLLLIGRQTSFKARHMTPMKKSGNMYGFRSRSDFGSSISCRRLRRAPCPLQLNRSPGMELNS